jgi:hypothetical protein
VTAGEHKKRVALDRQQALREKEEAKADKLLMRVELQMSEFVGAAQSFGFLVASSFHYSLEFE